MKQPLPLAGDDNHEFVTYDMNDGAKISGARVDDSNVAWLHYEDGDGDRVERTFKILKSEADLTKSNEHGRFVDFFKVKLGDKWAQFYVFEVAKSTGVF